MLVLLFDIDGTLIRSGGAGKFAMETALCQTFNVTTFHDRVPYSGRTDVAISHDLLVAHEVEPTPENRTKLIEAYLSRLPSSLEERGGGICPGIEAILEAVRTRDDVSLGLLTGNVRRGAERKLSYFGLWDYFAFGGFGDDHTDRDDVARCALEAAKGHLNREIDPASVWVIGDTPLDVTCARAIGAKVVAVATGFHPLSELEATGADLAFTDLSDVEGMLGHWGLN